MMQNKISINLCDDVKYIIDKLCKNGYEAYAVGGCVRDSILGKTPDDWDICTNALPNEIKRIFEDERLIDTGIEHGTITLILKGIPYEITTYRTEGKYSDFRRPDEVRFVSDIKYDLSRRDFTVNALAYNDKDGLIDEFCGIKDLEKKLIKCVGNANQRFTEDALRIMRAIRFCAGLGFDMEDSTKKAVFSNCDKLSNISVERINKELVKALLSENTFVLYEYRDVLKLFICGIEKVDYEIFKNLSKLPQKIELRISALFYFMEKSDVKSVLKNLKFETKTIKGVLNILECMKEEIPYNKKQMQKLIFKYDKEIVNDMLLVKENMYKIKDEADSIKKAIEIYTNVMDLKLVTKLQDININGNDIKNILNIDGENIGRVLNKLFYLVVDEKIQNKYEQLKECAKNIVKDLI